MDCDVVCCCVGGASAVVLGVGFELVDGAVGFVCAGGCDCDGGGGWD